MNGKHPQYFFLILFIVLAATTVCGCNDDSSSDTASSNNDDDDATDDDQADDDLVTDDDQTDDDIVSDDDTIDDDTITDDDTGDDDSTPDLPSPTYGWILMDTDREHISEVLAKTDDFEIDNVHLSHNLIMEIDEINDDPAQKQMLQEIAQEAHGYGLEVWVWSHEFTDVPAVVCFDPEDDIWAERQQQYRDALTAIPEIDGVILMFGSADTEPWYIPCFCEWCREQEPTGNPILDVLNSRPSDRAQQIYKAVGDVVMGEFGKKLRMRTFMHQPLEIPWLGKSLRNYQDPDLMVMTKDVPQDWQPYYPHNPLIGRVGPRHQIIEMDLGNEYWGASAILNGQVDYIYYRYTYDRDHGARGGAARIERGSNYAFGTPNEINIYAFTRLLQDTSAKPDDVYREWFEQRYGIDPDSETADTLKEIFRNSHYAMCKMYYTLGQWTLEKGSDVTSSARYPAQLWARSSAFYDRDWTSLFFSLVLPSEQTLVDLWQESAESREFAADNIALLESIEDEFADPADYAELHDMLELHEDCTEVWQLVKDTVYRFVYRTLGHDETSPFLEWNAEKLLDLADDIEARWGASISPGNPQRIRDFVADLRDGFPVQPTSEQWEQPAIFNVEAEDLGGGEYLISWQTEEPMTSFVEWATDLPLYENATDENDSPVTEHTVTIEVDEPGRHVFRVGGHSGQTLVRSGDFWFGLDD